MEIFDRSGNLIVKEILGEEWTLSRLYITLWDSVTTVFLITYHIINRYFSFCYKKDKPQAL